MDKMAVESGGVEIMLFRVSPTFDMHPGVDDLDASFDWGNTRGGIDSAWAEPYKPCERHDVGLTVMKPYTGGRLFDVKRPFGIALTPGVSASSGPTYSQHS